MKVFRCCLAAIASLAAGSQATLGSEDRNINSVESWTYYLQAADPDLISASGFDLAVVDYSADGSDEHAFSKVDVAKMKMRDGKSDRILLSYLSIGEAEDYRYYWKPSWTDSRPEWVMPENEEWGGNYPVDFWHPDWQRTIYGEAGAFLDKIIAAGFDGVYLDRIDVYWERREDRETAQADMVQFVRDLAAYARALRPGFLIVPQNAEGLLEVPEYMEIIDGIAKESLYYLPGKDGDRPPADESKYSADVLRQAVEAGKLVLTVDYVSEPQHVGDVYETGRAAGFIPYVTVRELDQMAINADFDPQSR
jgi:cysteinyl-tRNA synthetase, unknown class